MISEEYKFYSAKNDRAFKEVYLKEKNRNMLKDLLEKVLEVRISKIKLRPTEKLENNIHIKGKRLDALLDTNVGKIGIEVNSENKSYIHPRNMSYICNEYASHTLIGEEYNEETMIIQINFTYGLSKNEPAKKEYYIQDEKGSKFVRNFKIIEINMEYYLNLWYDFQKKGINKTLIEENQIIIMLGLEREDLKELSKEYEKVREFMSEIERVNENPEFRVYMTEEEDKRKIFNSEMREARETGLKEGKEEGIKEITKSLLNSTLSLEDISKYTGLSIDEIKSLK